jgi:hypothetical protein
MASAALAPLLKVRTVTAGITLRRGEPMEAWTADIESAAAFCSAASQRLAAAGFEVQTTRISTNSFEEYVDVTDAAGALDSFRAIDAQLCRLGIGLFSAGPAKSAAAIALAPDIVCLGPRISVSAMLSHPLESPGASAIAAAIIKISTHTGADSLHYKPVKKTGIRSLFSI